MAAVTLEHVGKRFGDVAAVDDVSLQVDEGEFIAVLGPSGCGKTTLLRLIAGFEQADRGTIRVGDRVVSGPAVHVPPEDRHIGMVFQSYALWPHMSVAENIGYPLRVRRLPAREVAREVGLALEAVRLHGLGDRRPAELSGGQRQRVALARCLAMKARVVLLDEPLANLDAHSRARMLSEIGAFRDFSRATLIYVTHDQAEALSVADRVAMMEGGRVRQIAAPLALYRTPDDADVGRFIGMGAVLSGDVTATGPNGFATVAMLGGRWRVRARSGQPTGPAEVCLRPEDLRVGGDAQTFDATVTRVLYQGSRTIVEATPLADPSATLTLSVDSADAHTSGSIVRLAIVDGWVIPNR